MLNAGRIRFLARVTLARLRSTPDTMGGRPMLRNVLPVGLTVGLLALGLDLSAGTASAQRGAPRGGGGVRVGGGGVRMGGPVVAGGAYRGGYAGYRGYYPGYRGY